jgi:hypothetical protein
MDKAPDNKALSGSDIPFPFESSIGRRLTMADIAYYDLGERKTKEELKGKDGKYIVFDHLNPDHYHVVPRLNKLGKIPNKTSWDSFAYALMMGHNVECHIVAVQRAQQLMDIEIEKVRGRFTWKHWKKVKGADMSDEHSDWVPRNILYFSSFVEELFNTTSKDEAFDMIKQAGPFLRSLEGARLQGGPAQNTFGSLFEVEQVTKVEEIDLSNPDDDKLRALEEGTLGDIE